MNIEQAQQSLRLVMMTCGEYVNTFDKQPTVKDALIPRLQAAEAVLTNALQELAQLSSERELERTAKVEHGSDPA